jgi:hypothetical protein
VDGEFKSAEFFIQQSDVDSQVNKLDEQQLGTVKQTSVSVVSDDHHFSCQVIPT